MDLTGSSHDTTPPKVKFCTECGSELTAGVKFCTSCGTPIALSPTLVTPVTPAPQAPRDVDLESDPRQEVREGAQDRIIAAVDIEAMRACAHRALARGDRDRAEFWLIEIATADADETTQADGVEELCDTILIPQLRFEEAELYSRWAATRADDGVRMRAVRTLDGVAQERAGRGIVRLEHRDAWRTVDLTAPAVIGQPQTAHYLRLLAYLSYRDQEGGLANLRQGVLNDFMPAVTGYLLGFMDPASATGVERETAVKALADWIDMWNGLA